MASSGCTEVREDGEWLAELATLRCELRPSGKNSLVHLWSDRSNLTRQVLFVREQTDDRIVLEVRRFGRAKPGRLEFVRTDSPRAGARVTREQFRARLQRVLAEQFPDAVVDSLSASPDLEHSLSGVYVRGRMHESSRAWAVMAIGPGESAAAVEGILTAGILWLDCTRARVQSRAIEGLRLLVPEGASRGLFERSAGLSSNARVEIFEFRDGATRMQKMAASNEGNVESWLTPRREVEGAIGEAREAMARIHALALHMAPAGTISGCDSWRRAAKCRSLFAGWNLRDGRARGFCSVWATGASGCARRRSRRSTAWCARSTAIATATPPKQIIRCIAPRRSAGWKRW
jgi:hypothetical protein